MKLAVYQAEAGLESWQQRLEQLDVALQRHTDQKADVVLCPELFMSGYANPDNVRALSVDARSASIGQLADLATHHDIDLCVGYPEICGEKRFNSACYLTARGELLANHRKRVLPSEYEKELFDTDCQLTVFDAPCGWRFAILVCYEVEFPEAVRACAQAGAQLLLVPTALGKEWAVVSRQLVPTRAFENNIFLAYANFSGADESGEYIGDSVVVSPRGRDLLRADEGPGMFFADLDIKEIDQARARLPYLADLRAFTD